MAATVNFATGTARVSFPASVSAGDLISVVEQAGYTASLPAARQDEPGGEPAEAGDAGEAGSLRQRLLVSLALAIPVVVLAMVPALQYHREDEPGGRGRGGRR